MIRHRSALIVVGFVLAVLGAPGVLAQSDTAAGTRSAFLKLIDRPRVPPAAESIDRPPASGHPQEHFTFASEAGERVPGILLKPAAAGRRPVVIVLHGTGDRKEGMRPLLETLRGRGFVAVAIDGRFHGERQHTVRDYDAAILEAYRSGRGHPFLYDTVWDVMRLVDYLTTRADVDPARIGLMGISKGGMETYLAAAADPRIAVAVPIIGVQSFRWALDHNAWRYRVGTFQGAFLAAAADDRAGRADAAFARQFYDRVVPGVYSDFDGPAMLPLIAPRPLLVINGDSDELTPLAGVREATTSAEQAYKTAGASGKFQLLIQPDTAHEFSSPAQSATVEWFIKWLKP